MMNEPTLDDIRREFPGWTVYRGTDRRWRARPEAATPPVEPVVGEDLADLRDQIKAKLSSMEEQRWQTVVTRPASPSATRSPGRQ